MQGSGVQWELLSRELLWEPQRVEALGAHWTELQRTECSWGAMLDVLWLVPWMWAGDAL